MQKRGYTATERIGVNKVESIFLNMNWIFREQTVVDMGIDAQVEQLKDGKPNGQLFGIQIKTGESHFYETEDTYRYYIDNTHYEYWTKHALPVLLIGHIPEKNITIWINVTKQTVEKTDMGWKIDIPKINLLDGHATKHQLNEIIQSQTTIGKINKLILDRELIEFLHSGGKINVYTEEWHNKTLGRGPFKVILIENGQETIYKEWSAFYTYDIAELVQNYFPWADIENDKEFFEENFSDSVYDVYTDYGLSVRNVYPYHVGGGEVGLYRINLKLNVIGKSIIGLYNYLE